MSLPNVMFRTALTMAALLLVTGCVNRSSATMAPGQNLDQATKYYVAKLGPDERGINEIISDRLILRGYQASTGLDIDTPEGIDVVVTYEDRWQWDMTMYMIELTAKFRDPNTQLPIASGNSYHTSLTRLTPAEMVDEVLDSIFAEAKRGSVSEAAAIASGPLTQSEQETQRGKQYANADSRAAVESLAALKVLYEQGVLSNEEYMRKQREVVNENTRTIQASLRGDAPSDSKAEANMSGVGSSTTAAPAAEKRFRRALFPIATSNTGPTVASNDVIFSDYAREYIRKSQDMELVFSAYDSSFDRDAAGTATDVWTSSFTQKIPNESSVVQGARRVGANVALLFAHKRRTAGWYGDDFVVDVYVMDIENRKTYKMQGDELNYEKTIETALNRLLSE